MELFIVKVLSPLRGNLPLMFSKMKKNISQMVVIKKKIRNHFNESIYKISTP